MLHSKFATSFRKFTKSLGSRVWQNTMYPGDPTKGRPVLSLLALGDNFDTILTWFSVPLIRFYGSVLRNKEHQSFRKALIIIMEGKIIQFFVIQRRPSIQAQVRRADNLSCIAKCRFSTGNGQK